MSFIDIINRVKPVEPPRIKEPVKPLVKPEIAPAEFRTKVYEQNFAAKYAAAKLNFWRDPPVTPPTVPATPPTTTSGSGTATTYRTGDATRPDIKHDNGFLQNPNDPNDPTPIPTVPPSDSDRDYYDSELLRARGAQVLEHTHVPFWDGDDKARELEDGIDAYQHFLEGNNADRNFSYDEFVSEDSSGQTVLNNAIADTQRGAEQLYNQMVAKDPTLAGQPVTFNVTSGAITVGGSDEYPYPDTENWQKAIGGHPIWNSATVTVNPPSEAGGEPQFSMNYTLHAEDRYNFNPQQQDIATGAPDSERGTQLERTGLAHQYTQYGTSQRDVTWSQGDISGTTRTENPNEGR